MGLHEVVSEDRGDAINCGSRANRGFKRRDWKHAVRMGHRRRCADAAVNHILPLRLACALEVGASQLCP